MILTDREIQVALATHQIRVWRRDVAGVRRVFCPADRDFQYRSCGGGNGRSAGELGIPPGNRLERLRGDRQGQHSIRINDQYRICLRWEVGDAYEVEIADYH